MKNRLQTILIGTAFALAAGSASQAMSRLASITLEPEWPTTSNPGAVVLYKVTVTRAGQGFLDVSLSSGGLPEGARASFSANPLRFTGRTPESLTSTLTITCHDLTPTDTCLFTVTGHARRSTMTVTNPPPQQPQTLLWGPAVLALDRLPTGGVRIRGTGAARMGYRIEATPDLAHPSWNSLGSSTADVNGRFIFTDTATANSPMRFYRAAY